MSKIFLLFIPVLIACSSRENTITPQIKPLVEAVYASGYLKAHGEYEIVAQAEGYVVEKLASDGNEVKKGDPLYILESAQQSSRFELAQKNYANAVLNAGEQSPVLKEMSSMLESARTKMKFDSVNYVRFKNLLDKNATSRSEYDRMQLMYQSSRNEYVLLQSRYENTRNRVKLELENARSQLAIASNESGRYVVRSEVDGLVYKTTKDKGELIRRGEAIGIVGNKAGYYLELDVDELDVSRLKVGQEVLVNIDAVSDKVLKGRVEKIYPFVNRQQQTLRVDASLNDTLPVFYSGLAVEANIVIREKPNALVVPRSALLAGDSIRVIVDGKTKVIKVTTGIESIDEVEIVDGIDKSTPVVVASKE